MKLRQKIVAVLTALSLMCPPPITAYAATTITFDISKGDVSITNSTYSGYNSSGVQINGSSSGVNFVITGATGSHIIWVSGTHNITLSNCYIDVSFVDVGDPDSPINHTGVSAFTVVDNNSGNVNVTLVGENTLKSGDNKAGLEKNGDTSTGTLTILGTGSLLVTGGLHGAGIGGGWKEDGSNINISGGRIIATSKGWGAGIGGGSEGSGSNITVSGGTVITTGGNYGAGIGGGYHGNGSNITISDGTVTATGGDYGAGIGGGSGHKGSNIIISGGSVKAVGGRDAYSIGCGSQGGGPVIPTDGNGNNVYLRTIPNPNSTPVYIDGVSYTPVNHKAADPSDTTLYAYLPGGTHEITVGVSISATLSTSSVEYGASAPTLSVEGTYSSLSYLSSKPEVATIDSSGVITIKGAGTTTFTVTAA